MTAAEKQLRDGIDGKSNAQACERVPDGMLDCLLAWISQV